MVRYVLLAVSACFLLTQDVAAQDKSDSWDWKVAPYLWTLAGTGETAIGPLVNDVDFRFSDVISNLHMAALLTVIADRGHHGFHADIQYMSLESAPTPGPAGFGEIQTDLDLTVLESAYHYHFSDTQEGGSLLAGLRYMDTTVSINPANVAGREVSVDWLDGFIGYQHRANLSGRWKSRFSLTAGTGGSDLTLTGQLTFGRETDGGNEFVIGARIWDFEYDETLADSAVFREDLTMYGLLVGFVFD